MIYNFLRSILASLLLMISFAGVSPAQENTPAAKPSAENVAKAQEVIDRATKAVGGTAYLNVTSVVGRGFFTTFVDGISQIPARFVDYIVYPDRERTEFTGAGIRAIQTNMGEVGWMYDGANKTLKDMTTAQVDDFKRSMRTSVENLLRGWWKKEGATLSYLGRREAGLARRNETVLLTYPDGLAIEYEFSAKDYLPAKIIYKRSKKKDDSDEPEVTTEEDRLAKPITVAGITAPWVIDHFTNGTQTSRVNYESIEYNQPLPDTLFAKPANVKSLK